MEKKAEDDQTFQEFNATSQRLIQSFLESSHFMQNLALTPLLAWEEGLNISHIYSTWLEELTKRPNQMMMAITRLSQDMMHLCYGAYFAHLNGDELTSIGSYQLDKRFKSSLWNETLPPFLIHQTYLLLSTHIQEFVRNNPCKNTKISKQMNFFVRQYLDAMSPSNFVLTNPDVMAKTIKTSGENLIRGYQNFLEDITRNKGQWIFKMTDLSAFEVGRNVATSKGSVIFQNKMIQLIQYHPTTETVYKKPLLIIPPWINKYYILDLNERKSLVKYLVDKGFTVFIISWVNPDKDYQETSFNDYLFQGTLPALETIKRITKSPLVNTIGFCIGGTLLATTLGYLKAKNEKTIESATFLATLIDFSDPGELEVFVDEEQINTLEGQMKKTGYLSGGLLMTAFNLLRENELFWPYYIKNYLMGENPFSFDLLFWNSDSTNLPAKMVTEYARNLYLENKLCEPFKFKIDDQKVNLGEVDTPSYFISTELDHIAPWKSTFKGAKCFKGPTTFVLGQSGHIAGIVNPPTLKKYGYYHSKEKIEHYDCAEKWFSSTQYEAGSWWEHWLKWAEPHCGEKVKARIPGEGQFEALQAAPGDYVKKKSA